MKLVDEIERCAAAFGEPSAEALSSIRNPELKTLIARTNSVLALSGAFVLFGIGDDPMHPLDLRGYRNWPGRGDYGLLLTDEVFGADIFGDLMFLRGADAFRLNGEMGEHVPLGAFSAWLEQDRSEAAEELGGNLARDRFGGQVIGEDPLRLLPIFPFMMKEFVAGEFFETPLSRAVDLKLRLFRLCRDTPDGEGVDCSFWKA